MNPLAATKIFVPDFNPPWFYWKSNEKIALAFAFENDDPFMYKPTVGHPSSHHLLLQYPMSTCMHCLVCRKGIPNEELET